MILQLKRPYFKSTPTHPILGQTIKFLQKSSSNYLVLEQETLQNYIRNRTHQSCSLCFRLLDSSVIFTFLSVSLYGFCLGQCWSIGRFSNFSSLSCLLHLTFFLDTSHLKRKTTCSLRLRFFVSIVWKDFKFAAFHFSLLFGFSVFTKLLSKLISRNSRNWPMNDQNLADKQTLDIWLVTKTLSFCRYTY